MSSRPSNDLFKSISPLFWFLRVTGGTPFHHLESSSGILAFRWCHPQFFWFTFVTLVHLSFISAQIFGGFFSLNADDKDDSVQSNNQPSTVRYTNFISQTRFLVDTFAMSKLLHFNLASFQNFFQLLNNVDRWLPLELSTIKRTRKVIVISIIIISLWHLALLIMGFHGICTSHRKLFEWLIVARIFDNTIHTIGQLHSNMLVIQFACLCYIIGLRFIGLAELLQETVATEHSLSAPFLAGWMSIASSKAKSSKEGSLTDDNPVRSSVRPTLLGGLRGRPLASRLVFLKMIYLSLSESILVHFNHTFGVSLLLYLVSKLISASISCHQFISNIITNGTLNIYFWALTNFLDIIGIFVVFQAADHVTKKINKFFNSVNKISTQYLTIAEKSEVQNFILQVRGDPIEFSVCGLFKLGNKLLPAVAGTIATYILVLVQFSASEESNKIT